MNNIRLEMLSVSKMSRCDTFDITRFDLALTYTQEDLISEIKKLRKKLHKKKRD